MNPESKKPVQIKIPDFNNPAGDINLQKPISINSIPDVKKNKKSNVLGSEYTIRGLVFLFLSIILLIAVYLVYNYAQVFLNGSVPATEQTLVFENALVRADKSRVLSLEAGASREQIHDLILQTILKEQVSDGEISLIMPSYLRDTTIDGQRKLVSELQRGDDFFFTFAPHAPINLRTIAAQDYALGVAGVGNVQENGTKNFLAFSVSSAPDATREMLNYEPQMYNDFKDLLKLRDINGNFYFKDLSDNNHILRVGYDDNGVVLVYGFGGPKTIIIAPDTSTFEYIYQHLK